MRRGSGYLGSPQIETTVLANTQILPEPPVNYTLKYNFYKFSFLNYKPCSVIINNGSPIFLDEKRGFICDIHDSPIWSFVIVESGVSYIWLGAI